ncbi:MAG TPA: SDR family oxidoreductase [Polyangia bacterium]|jgi:NAD(P)-dependent dehydrogenase (short-subunit alcohol dehydrogenase family)
MTPPNAPLAPSPVDAPVVLITGASSGIGHATARRFAARGWRVWASMRRPEKGEALRTEARERGWALSTPALDVTDDASVASAVAELLRATDGRIDLVINNAGYYALGSVEDTTPDELRAQLETNVIGVHRVTRAVLPAMRARRQGRVVVMSSLSGLVALPMVAPYHASKWALEALVESLRYELLPFGVAVVLIEPGPFETKLHDNEVAAAASRDPASPYASLMESYRHQSAKLRRASLPAVIDTIERASTVPRPRLRWPVGPSSFQAAYLRRLAPDWLYEWVVRLTFRIRRL